MTHREIPVHLVFIRVCMSTDALRGMEREGNTLGERERQTDRQTDRRK